MQYVAFSYARISRQITVIAFTVLIATSIALIYPTPLNAQSEDARTSCDQLIVSGHTGYPPFNFTDNGVFRGAAIDLIRMIARDIGIHVEIRNVGPWIRAVKNLTHGDIDLLVAIYHTPEREEDYVYSDPYAEDPIVMFTMANTVFPFNDWYDLVGKVGVTTRCDSWGSDFDRFIEQYLTMMRVNTTDQMIDMIAQDRANYGLQGLYSLKEAQKRTSPRSKIWITDVPISSAKMCMAFARTSPCTKWIPEINAEIERRIADGTVTELMAKHAALTGY